jgi:hypothetical protein
MQNCGACGEVCPEIVNAFVECGQGSDGQGGFGFGCTYLCSPDYFNCPGDDLLTEGCATHVANDPQNCGSCGATCGPNQYCCGCKCFDPNDLNLCSKCQEVRTAKLIRSR